MFTEITGNTDLYVQEACPCVIYCRESCLLGCDTGIARIEVRIEDLIFIKEEMVAV
ncbi:MAG: hypothetical protein PVH88_18145 [Ignavibacteria bacterium]|jgi:hypothetical protein